MHVPYRDSALTKVLKESLLPHCLVTMISCVSPSSSDISETINTLRFCNEAKKLRLKPLPAHLLEKVCSSTVKKARTPRSMFSTPGNGRINHTIHTGTPSQLKGPGCKRTLNSTIGTPGKRARGEYYQKSRVLTSTTGKINRSNNYEEDIDISGVSLIEPPPEDSSCIPSTSSGTTLTADVSTLLSPLMRALKENMQQQFEQFKEDVLKTKTNSSKTPLRTAKSRATSSPNRLRRIVDLNEDSYLEKTVVAAAEGGISGAGVSSGEPAANFRLSPDDEDDIISGVGVTLPSSKVRSRLRSVPNLASPVLTSKKPLPVYESPASTCRQHQPAAASPTLEEMEKELWG